MCSLAGIRRTQSQLPLDTRVLAGCKGLEGVVLKGLEGVVLFGLRRSLTKRERERERERERPEREGERESARASERET